MPLPPIDFAELPPSFEMLEDAELMERVDVLKKQIRGARNRFARFLPEIARRGLYRRENCSSLHQFAAMYAHMGPDHVKGVLRVWRSVQDKPQLRELFLSGEQGWSKIRVVVSVATHESDAAWAKEVQRLSKQQLETMVREIHHQRSATTRHGDIRFQLDDLQRADETKKAASDMAPSAMTPSAMAPSAMAPSAISSSSMERRGRSSTSGILDPSERHSRFSGGSGPVESPESHATSPGPFAKGGCEFTEAIGDDEGFRRLEGSAAKRSCTMAIDIAAMDEFQRYRHALEVRMGRSVSQSMALMRLLEPDREAIPIKTVLFREEQSGLLFGRSQWGLFVTAAELYGRAWKRREEMSYDEECTACERLLNSRARRKASPLVQDVAKSFPGEIRHPRSPASVEPATKSFPGEMLHPASGPTVSPMAESVAGKPSEPSQFRDRRKAQTPSPGYGSCPPPDEGAPTRRLPSRVRRFLLDIHGGRCSFPGCNRMIHTIHHSRRWRLFHEHDLQNLHPLCRRHDALVHAGCIVDETLPIHDWEVIMPEEDDPRREARARQSPATAARNRIDDIVQFHRMASLRTPPADHASCNAATGDRSSCNAATAAPPAISPRDQIGDDDQKLALRSEGSGTHASSRFLI